jgi:hypothetical protein
MSFNRVVMDRIKTVLAIAGAAVLVYGAFANIAGGSVQKVEAQSDIFLSRRIDQVEQRFYSLESRLNRIEMESRQPVIGATRPAGNEVELQYLRTQIDSLRTRLGEAECGLLKLDERTLTAAQRRATTAAEPCRRNWGERIMLSVRPGQ